MSSEPIIPPDLLHLDLAVTGPMLSAFRPLFVAAGEATARGPFLCLAHVEPKSCYDADAIKVVVDRLAQEIVWPCHYFVRPPAHCLPIDIWPVGEGPNQKELMFVVDNERRLREYQDLASGAAARLPEVVLCATALINDPALPCQAFPTILSDKWNHFVFRTLRAGNLLRSGDLPPLENASNITLQRAALALAYKRLSPPEADVLQGAAPVSGKLKLWWADTDAFAASVMAIDYYLASAPKLDQPGEGQATGPGPTAAKLPGAEAVHNADFTMVNWFGTEHSFALGIQASAVKALWEEWKRSGLGLHQETIRNAIDPERDSFRMDNAFRGHAAFGTMILPCGDGRYKLSPPDAQGAPSTPNAKTGARITSKARQKRV